MMYNSAMHFGGTISRPRTNFRVGLWLFCVMFWLVPASAFSIEMGTPGFIPERGDYTAAASVGFRNLVLFDEPAAGRYDSIKAFELRGKIGYQALDWLGLQARVGGATYNRKSTGFKGYFGPLFGLVVSFDPVQDHKGFGFSIIGGTEYHPIKGTVGPVVDATAKKLDAVAGVRFSYCRERSCMYVGGRYTYLSVWESNPASRSIKHTGGVFGGVDYYVTPNIFFGLEAQNFDGDAIYGGVGGRF